MNPTQLAAEAAKKWDDFILAILSGSEAQTSGSCAPPAQQLRSMAYRLRKLASELSHASEQGDKV